MSGTELIYWIAKAYPGTNTLVTTFQCRAAIARRSQRRLLRIAKGLRTRCYSLTSARADTRARTLEPIPDDHWKSGEMDQYAKNEWHSGTLCNSRHFLGGRSSLKFWQGNWKWLARGRQLFRPRLATPHCIAAFCFPFVTSRFLRDRDERKWPANKVARQCRDFIAQA